MIELEIWQLILIILSSGFVVPFVLFVLFMLFWTIIDALDSFTIWLRHRKDKEDE